jgi:exopolyphosphatase/guanosine-5'-triphosphate,3'-diphosphate pyrophosphatase
VDDGSGPAYAFDRRMERQPLTEIVPRWEWRTFGDGFGEADARLGAQPPERVQDSDEVYLLSLASDASVKLRANLVDIKLFVGANDDGLEQWRPVLKQPFPLSAADVKAVLSAVGDDTPPPLEREEYSLERFGSEVVGPDERLRTVRLHKHREHHTVNKCMVELTEFRTSAGSIRTIVVESEDAGRVAATVRELGLAGRPNICPARGLKALVGFGPARYAVIDVGTNSVKFHIGERQRGGWATIADGAQVTQLGAGLDETGRLTEHAVARTVEAIESMVDDARHRGVVIVAAVGTAGVRAAPNKDELIDAVLARTGVAIEVLSGEEEARLAYLGATASLAVDADPLVVFDTGGGSTQFTFGDGERVDAQFSIDVGAVRLTERLGLDRALSGPELRSAMDAIGDALSALDGYGPAKAVIALGGAVTNMAAVKHRLTAYDPDIVHGTVLDAAEINRQIELYGTRSADERRAIPGLQPKRAEVILAGACVVRAVLEKLRATALTVSDRGLRHGLLAERFGCASRPS